MMKHVKAHDNQDVVSLYIEALKVSGDMITLTEIEQWIRYWTNIARVVRYCVSQGFKFRMETTVSEYCPPICQCVMVAFDGEMILGGDEFDPWFIGDILFPTFSEAFEYLENLPNKGDSPAEQRLLQIIRTNPGANAYIDNDCWYLRKAVPEEYDDWDRTRQDEWDEGCELAQWRNFPTLGNVYGYGLLEAMALAFDLKLEGV